ncbi:MAG TPA: DUF2934 domain-containing protein [Nitrospiria bacterium]|jgi:hypothetical protein|nr:DUF2934 domain-containing protein [Nitrospiria bacterium]
MNKKENPMSVSSKSAFSEAVALNPELRERIAQKAYDLYEKRGSVHGLDVQDWLEAERLIMAQTMAETKAPKSQSKTESVSKAKTPIRERSAAAKPGSVLGRP